MDCYECALRGEAVAAVATCRHCGAGLCLDHLREAQAHRVGGTTFGCPHNLSTAVSVHPAATTAHGNGKVRELVGAPR